MRKVILSIVVIATISLTSCKSEVKTKSTTTIDLYKEIAMTELSFGVRGNCGMCKNTIEEAANSVKGVSSANWDVDKKKIDVSFDDSKTDVMAIHKAIAESGYDTEEVTGNLDTYNNLPGCCQYDHEMVMNQSIEKNDENH